MECAVSNVVVNMESSEWFANRS